MEYLVLFQQNFVLLTSQGFLQFLQIQLFLAGWRNFCLYVKDTNFYHIGNHFVRKFSDISRQSLVYDAENPFLNNWIICLTTRHKYPLNIFLCVWRDYVPNDVKWRFNLIHHFLFFVSPLFEYKF